VLTVLAFVSFYTLAIHMRIRDRWFENMWLTIFPIIILLASSGLLSGARRRYDKVPYGMAVVIFIGALMALAGSFWPYMIPFSVTIMDGAAPVQTLEFLFYGAGIVIFPIVLIYTGVVYWVLRGKV
jgi:cytochrome d ubiquinol oxidase subunit II